MPVEQTDLIVEPLADLRYRQYLDLGGGELNRERQAVEPPTDPRNVGCIEIRCLERVLDAHCALEEEARGLEGQQRLRGVRAVRLRHGQGRDTENGLAIDAQTFAAGRKDADGRGHRESKPRQFRASVEQVLAIVQDEQQRLRSEKRHHAVEDGSIVVLRCADDRGDRLRHECGIRQTGKLHEPHAVVKIIAEFCTDIDGESRFAGTPDADQCQQSVGGEEPSGFFDGGAATDEAR